MMGHSVRRIARGIVFFGAGSLVMGLVVMVLWNLLFPDIFHLPAINYWQAIGLLILSRALFFQLMLGAWGARFMWSNVRRRKRFMGWLHEMTPEEREEFRRAWLHHCGCGDEPGTGAQGAQAGE